MINIVVLQDTLNPVSAAERVKINQNWDAIRRGFSSVQNQIAFLSGGEDVDAIIQRIENAITMAETGAQNAIDNVNNNYAERVVEINQALSDLNVALTNAIDTTQATESERLLTMQATIDARAAIAELTSMINDFRSLGEYNSSTPYKRNNLVLLDGRTYIALQDNTNQPVTNNSYWSLFADRGQDGQRGPQGEAGASLNIIGVLPSAGDLPSSGNAGDAYTINGDLYVWSTESNDWVNVGQIKGEKGDKGDAGENGESGYYQLANFQYVINPTVNGQTTIEIPLVSFDINNHSLTLFRNGMAQDPTTYSIVGRNIILNEAVSDFTQTSFYLMITQGVLVQPRDTIDGNVIVDSSIGFEKLKQDVVDAINSSTGMATNVAGLNREVAYLKLRQQASERIEGGTVFAEDFNGSRFGFTLNEAESNAIKIADGKLIMSEFSQRDSVYDDVVVVNQPYRVRNNGGRKIVRILNGTLISGAIDNATGILYIYRLNLETKQWVQLTMSQRATVHTDFAMAYHNGMVTVLAILNASQVTSWTFNPETVPPENQAANYINVSAVGLSQVSGLSLAADSINGNLHASWTCIVSNLPGSTNIQYSNSTNGGTSWSTVKQVTEQNQSPRSFSNTSLAVHNSIVYLIHEYNNGTVSNRISYYTISGGVFNPNSTSSSGSIFEGMAYAQDNPSVTVDNNGLFHVAWNGYDNASASTYYIRYSNASTASPTWSPTQKLVVGKNPSITVGSNNDIFIVYENLGNIYYIVSTDSGANWSSPVLVSAGTNPSVADDISNEYSIPAIVSEGASSVIFNTTLMAMQETPTLSSTVVYDIDSTDYIGAFIAKVGALEVTPYINGEVIQTTLSENEYSLEHSLATKSPVKLRLELTRTDVSGGDNDALTRILGGRS